MFRQLFCTLPPTGEASTGLLVIVLLALGLILLGVTVYLSRRGKN